jgi:hypothetical protein
MISKKLIAAGLIAAASLTAVPASANGGAVGFSYGNPGWSGPGWNHQHRHHWQHRRLYPGQVRWILRQRGYRHIRFVDTRGPVYQVSARWHGRAYFLVLSARNGEVLSRIRI